MHEIAFGAKRTFHGFLRVSRRLHASFGLTPARFDLLYAVGRPHREHRYGLGKYQSDLGRALGVTPPVVSRMLRSLEKLGLVRRSIPEYRGDRRQRFVELTPRGVATMRAACHVVFRSMKRIVDVILSGPDDPDRSKLFWRMSELTGWLDALRRKFGDRSTVYFPWGHPDD